MKIGFIGLGIMGRPMSKNLIKAGYDLCVCDIVKEAVADVVACGAESAETSKEVAQKCDIIITMLPNSPQVRTVLTGENGVLEGIEGEKVFSREDGLTQAEIQFHEEVVYEDGTDVRDRIFKIMCEQNIPLVELYFKKPTLEQVFMELTQEES